MLLFEECTQISEMVVGAVYTSVKFIPLSVLLYNCEPFATYILLSSLGSIAIKSISPVPIVETLCCTHAPPVDLYNLEYPAKSSPRLFISNGVTQFPPSSLVPVSAAGLFPGCRMA